MKCESKIPFEHLTTDEQRQLEERLTTLGYEALAVEEQELVRNRLATESFAGYPPQMWIGLGGPVRKGDLLPPAFSTPPNASRSEAKGDRGVLSWLKELLGIR